MTSERSNHLLLIEDDAEVARIVTEGLSSRGNTVDHAPDLRTGRHLLSTRPYDAVILDLTLPDGNGLDLASSLRTAGRDMPILVLTAHGSVQDRVTGLERGADDYLCKPFDVDELAARLGAILRRRKSQDRHVMQFADVQLDLLTRTVRRADVEAALSAREVDLLAFFLRHANQVVSREQILESVWGEHAEDESNVVNVYVNYLRNKLEQGRLPRLIHTVRGVGYILSETDPEERAFNGRL